MKKLEHYYPGMVFGYTSTPDFLYIVTKVHGNRVSYVGYDIKIRSPKYQAEEAVSLLEDFSDGLMEYLEYSIDGLDRILDKL